MTRRTWLILIACSLIVMGGLLGLTHYYINLPDHLSQHETIVLGQQRLIPGAQAAIRVVVRDSRDAAPLPNATVNVLMRPQGGGREDSLFEGRTDVNGDIEVTFTVPENAAPDQILVIETRSPLGADTLEHPVTVQRDDRIHLTTDKPLYRPGDIIHIRALALSAFERRPAAEQRLRLTVTDARGNTVFRQTLTTSSSGVAAANFQLADEVNGGPYRLTATLGGTSARQTVTVLAPEDTTRATQADDLAAFDINMTTERDFYRPAERVTGTLRAVHAFGKPIVNGKVTILGSPGPIISATVHITGQTDVSGNFDFTFDLPPYGEESAEHLEDQFHIEAHVSDTAHRTETQHLTLSISEQALGIEAIPEGGQFHPGVENILYVLTQRPDGAPVETNLTVRSVATDELFRVQTGPYGLAEVRFTPQTSSLRLDIEAEASDGALARRTFDFTSAAAAESVLLRPDAPLYRVGDTLRLTILTSEPTGVVYLDIAREGQTATPAQSSRAIPIVNGQAKIEIALPSDLFGTLHLHAYKILRSGEIVHATRRVVVEVGHDLSVALAPGAGAYRPGDTATLHVRVTDTAGAGLPAELGIAIIEESTYTLAERDPGRAKLTFLLEEALLTPRYQLHGLGLPDMIGAEAADEPALRAAQAGVAAASLAAAPAPSPFTLRVDSHADALARTRARQSESLAGLTLALHALLLLISLIILTVNAIAIWRATRAPQRLWRRVGLAVGSAAAILLLLSALPTALPGDAGIVERLRVAFDGLAAQGGARLLLALVGLGGLVVASLFAVHEQDYALGLSLGLILLCGFIGGNLLVIAAQINDRPALTWPTLLILTLLSVGILLRAVDFILAHRPRPAVALIAVTLFLLIGAPALIRHSRDMGTAPSPSAAVTESKALPSLGQSPSETPEPDAEGPPRRPPLVATMLWLPSAITDENGALQVDFPVADSITTWRVAALASAQDGRLGSATSDLRVFQDFFIAVELPPALTVGDQISVPVAIYNYLPEPQTLQLEVEQARWFELLSASGREIEIAPNDVTRAYVPLRVLDAGRQTFQVTAWGSAMSDALRKEVRVAPDGKAQHLTRAGLVTTLTTPLSETVTFPDTALPGTPALTVKLTPGVINHLVASLDAIQRRPGDSFEPTVSAAYPSVLMLNHLQETEQTAPEVRTRARKIINAGYQQLTTFEVPEDPGGFSRFGQAPADPVLTAYGLQALSDMQRVHPVDPALRERMAAWLFGQQWVDGSWAGATGILKAERLPVTAFVLWGLADAGYASDVRAQRAANFLQAALAENEEPPGYTLALIATALVAMDTADEGEITPATGAILRRLRDLAIHEGDAARWESGRTTYLGSTGASANLETTALAALALFRAEHHGELAHAAVTMLSQNKDGVGAWHTTSATVMALRALMASTRANAGAAGDATIATPVTLDVILNAGAAQSVRITPEVFNTVQAFTAPAFTQTLTFGADDVLLGAENTLEIQLDHSTPEQDAVLMPHLMYQIVGEYYIPWDDIAVEATTPEAILLNVAYDRPELAIGETVEVEVMVMLNPALTPAEAAHWTADSAIIEVGIPPGFEVQREDLGQIVSRLEPAPDDPAAARVERCELAEGRIILYVTNLTSREPLTFTYRLRATFPVVAQTPASIAYDAYNPDVMGKAPPQTLTVIPAVDE